MLVIVQALDFDISRNTQTNKFVDDFEIMVMVMITQSITEATPSSWIRK